MPFIERSIISYLQEWETKPHRKPLLLRGARQVGKSNAVRAYVSAGERAGTLDGIVEINLEANPDNGDLLIGPGTPKELLPLIEARFGKAIAPGRTVLFIDEVQRRPDVIKALWFWYENLPELQIIAAGSLLDVALRQGEFSMPVGRIEHCFIGPLTFSEFLGGVGDKKLAELLSSYQIGDLWPEPIHQQLIRRLRDFWAVGGMPEAAAMFAETSSLLAVESVKRSVTTTYQDDFAKYAGRFSLNLLQRIFRKVPTLVGQRAKFVEFDRNASSQQVRTALELLTMARVITRVRLTSGAGLPLGAAAHDSLAKYLFLDVGLQLSMCDFNPSTLLQTTDLTLVNRGSIAEQFIGQHLLYSQPPFFEPELYYWERSEKSASAELDFLIAHRGMVVPIEVKSGAPGRMKALQQFCARHDSPIAVRFSAALPERTQLSSKTTLLSLPLYLVGEMRRLLG
jgi:predicted AAA+ superfamily ATPase